MTNTPHWAGQYIGTPWENGAQGPDAYDCWSFFRMVQREHYGRDVPFVDEDADNIRAVMRDMSAHDERANWTPVESPKDGSAVLMAHSRYPSHVGVWIDVDGGGVLHCVRGEGVVFSSIASLKAVGWGRLEFFNHASDI